jgi:hypothetical protein
MLPVAYQPGALVGLGVVGAGVGARRDGVAEEAADGLGLGVGEADDDDGEADGLAQPTRTAVPKSDPARIRYMSQPQDGV